MSAPLLSPLNLGRCDDCGAGPEELCQPSCPARVADESGESERFPCPICGDDPCECPTEGGL